MITLSIGAEVNELLPLILSDSFLQGGCIQMKLSAQGESIWKTDVCSLQRQGAMLKLLGSRDPTGCELFK